MAAEETGADGIECDVHMTKDGKLAAHYENSVLITSGDPFLLTRYK